MGTPTSERFQLAPLEPRDLPALIAMHADPQVMVTLGGKLWSGEQCAVFLDRMMAHWRAHGFGWWSLRSPQDEFLGRGGLRHVLVEGVPEIEVGYGIVAKAWGRGLATELAGRALEQARTLGLHSVVSFTLPNNLASRRVMEKSGLRYERDITHAALSHVLYRIVLR